MRCHFLPLLVAFANITAGNAAAQDLGPLANEVRKVVHPYYPKAEITLKGQTIHFEFNTRKFMIHEPTKNGEWQDAHEEPGPQRGGIDGDLELRAGPYLGQAMVPQAFDMRYFTLLVMAPYEKKLDRHLYVHLKFPRDASPKFLQEFQRVVNDFGRFVTLRPAS